MPSAARAGHPPAAATSARTPDPAAGHPEDPFYLAHDVRIACMRVSRRVRFESKGQVAPHQFSVLARLEAQPRTAGELAACERVSPPSMSRTVNGLVELGLVTRESDEHDGRVVRVAITPEGAAVIEQDRERRDAWMAERLAGLTQAERDVLRQATDLLEAVMAR